VVDVLDVTPKRFFLLGDPATPLADEVEALELYEYA